VLSAADHQSRDSIASWVRGHRAAIGVTEENDCGRDHRVEETGRISIVEDGNLEYDIDGERLRERLKSVVTLRGPRQAAAGRILIRLMAYHPFRNLGLKFVSTLVAILLWLVVAGERVVERVMRAPVEFQNLPAGSSWSAIRRTRRSAAARIVGRAEPDAAGDMSAVIDLATARPGGGCFTSRQNQVNVPYGIEIVQVGRRR
jgi:hypothetical protein